MSCTVSLKGMLVVAESRDGSPNCWGAPHIHAFFPLSVGDLVI